MDLFSNGDRVDSVFFMAFAIMIGAGVGRVVILAGIRGHMRQRYNIRGTHVEDLVFACCCDPCVTCQLMAEVSAGYSGLLI